MPFFPYSIKRKKELELNLEGKKKKRKRGGRDSKLYLFLTEGRKFVAPRSVPGWPEGGRLTYSPGREKKGGGG